jgi:uncharacterized protein DUF6455
MHVSTRFWPTFQQVVRRQKLMLRMMEAMGVNVPDAMRVDGGLAFLEAQGKCRSCANDDSCRQWLDSSEQARGTPEYCPNVTFFEGLKRVDLDGERESASRLCPVCRTSMVPEASLTEGQQRYNCPSCSAVVELSNCSGLL